MAASLSVFAGKDGAGATIVGGVQALDLSGTGNGPWSMAHILVDGQAGVNRMTIKPASTAPLASDPAIVVALSPNGLNANLGTNADAIAASATAAAPVFSFLSGFNGTTWDRLQVDGSKNLKVALNVGATSLALGTQASVAAIPVTAANDQVTIAVAQDTTKIANGLTGTNLTPKYKIVSASASGANIVVPAVGGKKIRVLAWDVKVHGAVNFKWQSHTAGDITGLYENSAQGDGMGRSFCPVGYFETTAGESLDLNLSAAVATGGVLTYVEV